MRFRGRSRPTLVIWRRLPVSLDSSRPCWRWSAGTFRPICTSPGGIRPSTRSASPSVRAHREHPVAGGCGVRAERGCRRSVLGGTNAHVVIEQAPDVPDSGAPAAVGTPLVSTLVVSGKIGCAGGVHGRGVGRLDGRRRRRGGFGGGGPHPQPSPEPTRRSSPPWCAA